MSTQLDTYNLNALNSGWVKRGSTISRVDRVRVGMALVEAGDATYVATAAKVNGRGLAKGMIVFASYNGNNQGAGVYEVLGFTDDDQPYGEGGVKFDTIADVLKAKNVKSLKALEELQDANPVYGCSTCLVVRDVATNESGPWFTLFQGRWSIGSSADPLSFVEVKVFNQAEYDAEQEAKAKAEERIRIQNRINWNLDRIAELERQNAELQAQLAA